MPITAMRTVSLTLLDLDEPSAPTRILGIASVSPAVIELFRNFLRVVFILYTRDRLAMWRRCRDDSNSDVATSLDTCDSFFELRVIHRHQMTRFRKASAVDIVRIFLECSDTFPMETLVFL